MRAELYLLLLIKKYRKMQKNRFPLQIKRDKKYLRRLYISYTVLKAEQEPAYRSVWVREIFREERRFLQGDSDNLVNEMRHFDDEKFFDYFRMSKETFDGLLALVGPKITKRKVVRNPIPAKTRLEICLRYLASGYTQDSLSFAFRVSQNTISKIIFETCTAIWDVLSERVFPELTDEFWKNKAEEYKNLWNFPNCIGSIDGKHCTIESPPNSGSEHYNYKGHHSIVLLAVTDAKCKFIMVDIGAEGKRSDGGIFNSSDMGVALANDSLNLPPPRPIEENGHNVPFVLVGDEAFGLNKYLMRPYSRRNHLDVPKKVFNYRLSRARSVECAFGMLSARFRIFRRTISTSLLTAIKIVQASVCLHNLVLDRHPVEEPNGFGVEEENNRNVFWSFELEEECNLNNATNIREAFKRYFCTNGAISQQWEKALNNDF